MLHMAMERIKIYVHGNHHVKLNVENKNTLCRNTLMKKHSAITIPMTSEHQRPIIH